MKILPLNIGNFNTMCCFFDTKKPQVLVLNATTDRDHLEAVFKEHKNNLVVMEACGTSDWINDPAISHDLKTFVCSSNDDACRVFH